MKNKKNHIWVALTIIAAFVLFAFFGLGDDLKGVRDMRLGIDIKGGVEAVFEPVGMKHAPSAPQLESARNVIESRLDAKNITDREVTVDKKEGHIIVRFPWKSDEKEFNPEAAISELGETAKLTFRDPDGNVLIEGQNVKNSQPVKNTETGGYEVQLSFDSRGTKEFAEATGSLVGQQLQIYMDDTLISSPVVQQKITGGEAVINGMESMDSARALSEKIHAGALPFSMETTNYNTISPSLGNDALKAMVAAAAVSFALICIFMIYSYRLPGAISCMTLVFQMSLQILALSLPQYTLTLPGIAGLILSVGMAVDANIIISERIQEELKRGKRVRQAVKNGYKNAFSSVLDGNITTAAVALILMLFGSGTMLSFGYTLFTGVIINLLAGVWLSRFMLTSAVRYDMFHDENMFRRKKEQKLLRLASGRRKVYLITAAVLLAGAAASAANGIRLDTQFTGGAILRYTYTGEADTAQAETLAEGILDRPVSTQISEDPVSGQKKLILTLAGHRGIAPDEQEKVLEALNKDGEAEYMLSETSVVEPYIGAKALRNSAVAIGLSSLFIVLYIWIRFSALSGLSAGITAVIALLHDVAIVFFVFGVGKIPLNDAFVAVTLTIIGYSINDTIVLYDRIRENLAHQARKKEGLCMLVDRSITETIGRSVRTAFTTALCAAVVLAFSFMYDIGSIKVFALPLLAGVISGCYSSVCIAGPLWITWKEFKERRTNK
ncbi:protein translocase subunit SecD [Dorea sp. D27]|uniref:protein translocase subunit SecD n=1 Tax=Dorea sp. D27 TaxID=658665 RepID=UPI0006737927|nr:protein translocase subunit SecD [Dorea sp. D27]KMZ55133.1 putative protein-export membrane protein SecDF [Dorea sp. D27]